MSAVLHRVVHATDGDDLRRVPVLGSEHQERRGGGAFSRIVAFDGDLYVSRWRAVQDDAECRLTAAFGRGQIRVCIDCDPRRLIIGVGELNRITLQPVVARVGALCRADLNRVGYVAVARVVIDAGDGHDLGGVPVRRSERDARRAHRAFAFVAALERDRDVGRRLRVEHDGERLLSATFRGAQRQYERGRDSRHLGLGLPRLAACAADGAHAAFAALAPTTGSGSAGSVAAFASCRVRRIGWIVVVATRNGTEPRHGQQRDYQRTTIKAHVFPHSLRSNPRSRAMSLSSQLSDRPD